MSKSFLTGSRVYGTPKEDSDLDLCVFVTQAALEELRKMADKVGNSRGDSLMFGKLNLLCFTKQSEFEAWHNATVELCCIAPVSRDRAIEEIAHHVSITEGAVL